MVTSTPRCAEGHGELVAHRSARRASKTGPASIGRREVERARRRPRRRRRTSSFSSGSRGRGAHAVDARRRVASAARASAT